MNGNKAPWYAASLSWIFPGIGQIYAGQAVRGSLLILFSGVCYASLLASLMSSKVPIPVSFVILVSFLVLRVLISIDAFKVARKSNTSEFEANRKSVKDPWLSVFLSLLLPGLGHAYIRKFFFCVLYIFVFVTLTALSKCSVYIWVILPIYSILVCFHAYSAATNYRGFKKTIVGLFTILVIALYTTHTVVPWVTAETFVQISNPAIGPSMEPTTLSGDKIIVNTFIYIGSNPKIGDIVIIPYPKDFYPPKQYQNLLRPRLVKRIVAAEGESVQVIDDKILVNGVERKFNIAEKWKTLSQAEIALEVESMKPYLRFAVSEPYVVSKGCYFVLGDNLGYSVDSRYFGAFPKKDIIGKVVKICWPPSRIRTLD